MLWKSVDMLKQDLGLLSVQWSTQRQVSCLGAVTDQTDRLVPFSKLSCSVLRSFLLSSVLPIFPQSFFNFVSVRQLHREFQRAGADVMQAFTFSLDDDWEGDYAKYGVCIIISICHYCVETESNFNRIRAHNHGDNLQMALPFGLFWET